MCPDNIEQLCILFIHRSHWDEQTHRSPDYFPWKLLKHIYGVNLLRKEKQRRKCFPIYAGVQDSGVSPKVHKIHMQLPSLPKNIWSSLSPLIQMFRAEDTREAAAAEFA